MAVKKGSRRNIKGEGTVEKRGDRYRGYFRVSVDGEWKKVGLCSGLSVREVRMKLNTWKAQGGIESILQPPVPDRPAVITGRFLQEWFDGKLTEWAATTCDTNRQNFDKHVKTNAALWDAPLNTIGYKAIIEFKNSIVGSPNTKRNVMRLVRPAFDRAVRLEHISKNPFDLLDQSDKPKRSKSRIVFFRVDQMQKLLRYIEQPGFDPLWRALILFGFDFGAEPEEFLGVQVGDINWKTGHVHIQRTCVEAGGDIIVKPEMKADKRNRKEPVSELTLRAIEAHVGHSKPLNAHVFSPDGKPWSYDAFIKLWRKLLVDAGVDHLPPLAMRHTMATMMLSKGEPIPAVSKRLGHASIVTTLTHYVHAVPSDSERLASVSASIFHELLRPQSVHEGPSTST